MLERFGKIALIRAIGGAVMVVQTILMASLLDASQFAVCVAFLQFMFLLSAVFGLGMQPQQLRAAVLASRSGDFRRYSNHLIVQLLVVTAIGLFSTLLIPQILAHFAGPTPDKSDRFFYFFNKSLYFTSTLYALLLITSAAARGFGYTNLSETSQFLIWRVLLIIGFSLAGTFAPSLNAENFLNIISLSIAAGATICIVSLLFRLRKADASANNRRETSERAPVDATTGFENLSVRRRCEAIFAQLATQSAGVTEATLVLCFLDFDGAAVYLLGTRFSQWIMFFHRALDASAIKNLVNDSSKVRSFHKTLRIAPYYIGSALGGAFGIFTLVFTAVSLGIIPENYLHSIPVFSIIAIGFVCLSATGPAEQYLLVNGYFSKVILSRLLWIGTFSSFSYLIDYYGSLTPLSLAVCESAAFAVLAVSLYKSSASK